LLVPGRNCWRIERARRLGFLIDAAAYYAAVRSAITFVDRVRAAVTDPGPVTYAALAADAALIVVAALFVWRRFGRRHPAPTRGASASDPVPM
jgi:hypothetical protein